MPAEIPDPVDRALAQREAFSRSQNAYEVETTVFEASLTVEPGATDEGYHYVVRVGVPDLSKVTEDEVGAAVARGWFETMERRLADAPAATRLDVSLEGFQFAEGTEGLAVTYRFEWDNPAQAASIAKAFVEYVEGTYVESVIPGYEYKPPVADLLGAAASRGGGTEGGTPL